MFAPGGDYRDMAEKIVIGLTGNIATGKSLVLRMLQELGAATIDADKGSRGHGSRWFSLSNYCGTVR